MSRRAKKQQKRKKQRNQQNKARRLNKKNSTSSGIPVTKIPNIANLDIRRRPTTVPIRLDQLVVPEIENVDETFNSLHMSHLLSDTPISYTRVHDSEILCGFLKESDGYKGVVCDLHSDEGIKHMQELIQAGRRPPLYLYEIDEYQGRKYACSDDQNTLLAYRKLGIQEIPAVIMGRMTYVKRAYFSYVFLSEAGRVIFQRAQWNPKGIDLGYRVFTESPTIGEILEISMNELQSCLDHLRTLHQNSNEIHWHEIVTSNLIRAQRLTISISSVFETGFVDCALPLIRTFYEMAIMFYVDWLSPEKIGPSLSRASQISRFRFNELLKEGARRLKEEGMETTTADLFERALLKEYNGLSSVKNRAMLSPLREDHKQVYHSLSSLAHQDSKTASFYSGYLNAGLNYDISDKDLHRSDLFLSMSVFRKAMNLLLYCVKSDIGMEVPRLTFPNQTDDERP